MTIRKLILLAAVPAVFGLTACGSGAADDGVASANGGKTKPTASATPSVNPTDAALKFAQCMRQNGVDMEDPDPSQPGRIAIKGGKDDQKKTQAAMKKCQPILQAGREGAGPDDPKERDRMLKLAQCMRQHGIDMPDPKPGEGIQLRMKPGMEEKFKAAQKACQQYEPPQGGPGQNGGQK